MGGELAPEPSHEKGLGPDPVDEHARGGARGLEVDRGRGDDVLRAEPRLRGDHPPLEGDAPPGAKQGGHRGEPLGPVHLPRLAAYPGERPLRVAPHARELGRGLGGRSRRGAEGEGPGPNEVRDALAHLVVEDAVVLPDERRRRSPGVAEELAAAHLVRRQGDVGNRELDRRAGAEVVPELAVGREHRTLRLLARRLVADVREGEAHREDPRLHLAQPVGKHRLVPDRRAGVARGGPDAAALLGALRELPLAAPQAPLHGPLRGAPTGVARRVSPSGPSHSHGPPPPSPSSSSCTPCPPGPG